MLKKEPKKKKESKVYFLFFLPSIHKLFFKPTKSPATIISHQLFILSAIIIAIREKDAQSSEEKVPIKILLCDRDSTQMVFFSSSFYPKVNDCKTHCDRSHCRVHSKANKNHHSILLRDNKRVSGVMISRILGLYEDAVNELLKESAKVF